MKKAAITITLDESKANALRLYIITHLIRLEKKDDQSTCKV